MPISKIPIIIWAMDILTHALSGVLAGKAIRDKLEKIPPKIAIFIFTIGTLFPDSDIIYRFISQEAYLYNHRGITHSFLILPIWGLLLTLFWAVILKYRIFLKKHNEEIPGATQKTLIEIYIISCLGLTLHIFFDLITTYGTMVLSPISYEKYNIGSVFIADLFFTSIIGLGIFFSNRCNKYQFKPIIASGFFVILFGYVGLTQFLKYESIDIGKNSLAIKANTQHMKIKSFPMAFSPLKWKLISYSASDDTYWVAFVDLTKDNVLTVQWEEESKWGHNPILSPIAEMAWEDPILDQIRGVYIFPMFHKLVQNDDKICIYYKDLRFEHNVIQNPFIYGLCSPKNGDKFIEKFVEQTV